MHSVTLTISLPSGCITYMENGQGVWFLTLFFLSSDKNLVSESSYEVQTPDSRCQDRSSFLGVVFALSLLPRHGYIQLSSWVGCQCLCYLCCFPSPSYAKPCLVVTFSSSSVSSASFAKSSFTIALRARIILLLFCASSSDSNHKHKRLMFQPDLPSC